MEAEVEEEEELEVVEVVEVVEVHDHLDVLDDVDFLFVSRGGTRNFDNRDWWFPCRDIVPTLFWTHQHSQAKRCPVELRVHCRQKDTFFAVG